MSMLPFLGIAAIVAIKDRMGSYARRDAYTDKYTKSFSKPTLISRTRNIFQKIDNLPSVDFGQMKIINLTPHSINVMVRNSVQNIPRSGAFVRIASKTNDDLIPGFGDLTVGNSRTATKINIHFIERNKSQSFGLFPKADLFKGNPKYENTWFLVSKIAAIHMRCYPNILVVGEGTRDIKSSLSLPEEICAVNLGC